VALIGFKAVQGLQIKMRGKMKHDTAVNHIEILYFQSSIDIQMLFNPFNAQALYNFFLPF